MRTALILALGLAIGWLARELTLDKTKAQAPSRMTGVRDSAGWHGPDSEEGEANKTPPAATPPPRVEEKVAEKEEAARATSDALAQLIKTQGPAWKAMAMMQAKPKIRALVAALGFDEDTQKRIEEELLADVDAQFDLAIRMLLGQEDLDPNVLEYFLGVPPELNAELEKKLASFLSDEDVAVVREQVRTTYKTQVRDMADAQIKMMDIADLSDGQRAEMRDVFEGKNFMKDQLTRMAKVTRNPEMLQGMLAGGEVLEKIMTKQFEPTRNRVRKILSDDQFVRYQAYEQKMIKQAEFSLKMFRAMTKMGSK